MMLCCFMWLLCLSAARAEITPVYQSKHVTLKCSALECHAGAFVGMYVYKDDEEVLYYNDSPNPDDQIVPQQKIYVNRLQKIGCLQDNIITITNATAADSGIYKCVYVTFPRRDYVCNNYTIKINEEPTQPPVELPGAFAQESTQNKSCPSLPYIIILTSAVSVLLTLILTLLVILVAKRWTGRRRLTKRTNPGVSNEYVYETMTKNGFRPLPSP